LLQGRSRIGWGFLAAYLGSKYFISFLLGGDLITVATSDTLAWLPVALQWSSMIEAPLAMRRAKS
jgi:hypothetical protein